MRSSDVNNEQVSPPDDDKDNASSGKRSEGRRHVFTSSLQNSRTDSSTSIRPTQRRVTHSAQHRRANFSIRRERPRISFHRVLSSLFTGGATATTPSQLRSRTGSSASDLLSCSGPNAHDSLQSLELISPGTFIFSGPSLRSANSSSLGNETSRVPSQSSLNVMGNGSHLNVDMRCDTQKANSETNSNDSGSFMEDGILEPFLYCNITRSMSDVLLGVSSPIEEMDDPISEDANEESHVLSDSAPLGPTGQIPYQLAPLLPPPVLLTLLYYLDFATYKSMRLTCRSWFHGLKLVAPPKFPASYNLPNEIIQHVYDHLGPTDFNAARHTCRSWMIASLDRSLLVSMLKRGSWWSSAEHDIRRRRQITARDPSAQASEEWFLSTLLSRECALAPNWTGNGLVSLAAQNEKYQDPLVETARTDFGDLANGYAGPEGRHSGGLVITVSVCGRFLLVAEGGMIYIYELVNNDLRPLTSVVCPRRVLAMSMDATSHRFAIAALLDGRMGLVCDLHLGREPDGDSLAMPTGIGMNSEHHAYRYKSKASIFTSGLSGNYNNVNTEDRDAATHDSSMNWNTDIDVDEQVPEMFNTVDLQADSQGVSLHGTNNPRNYDRNRINRNWNLRLRGRPSIVKNDGGHGPFSQESEGIALETGPRSIYRHLCSDDDPPRSVSICPQRRCVAFGCSAGIELHWVDALTGQDLNRWFPLTAPSDFLYFLPPRPGVDSAKKLRLISSAAHPSDRPSICRRFFSSRPALSLFWSSFGFENRGPTHGGGVANCDHFRAVPLSDGYHVLFTDPNSSKLFLGSDAPLGGPTKLLRKILLVPPEQDDIPRLYTTAADLGWGARIVVAYGDTVVLYSVPPDVFALSKLDQKAESLDVYPSSSFTTSDETRDCWINWWPERDAPHHPVWPLAVRGTVIGTVDGLVELAIYTKPDLTIWAFGLDGRARTWQVDSGQRPILVAKRNIGRDGIVNDTQEVDADGDVVMADVEMDGERSIGLDGHDSLLLQRIPRALHVDNDKFVDFLDLSSGEAWYDQDGDIVMYDAENGSPVGWAAEDTMVQRAGGGDSGS